MTTFKTSITDIPKLANDKDNFGIEKFEKGLIKFIENSNTPLTIALQGEWGSGKTSLMNSLRKNLCDDEKNFHGIWLNTWQYSLMKEYDQALISIIKGLTEEVINSSKNQSNELQKAAERLTKVFEKVFTATAKIAVKATTGQDGTELINAFTGEHRETTILQLRNELNETVKLILESTNKEGFIFFIDDLDRIDPPIAVIILELLKNIFDLSNCIFILAIDYDVVIKGLEPKFGKFTEENEREFRSFFDKIIQLPFSMPVTSYEIDSFLKDSLISIGYLNQGHSKNEELLKKFTLIANLSVGTNPRSIKRMLNYLSLISCINNVSSLKKDDDLLNEELELLVNFALVCIQISFPSIYKLLNANPDFVNWDKNVAFQMNLKELDDKSYQKLNELEEFDEEWEKILFRYCEKEFYLKKNALKISRLLNELKRVINASEENESVGDIIGTIIALSSVTNMEAFDKPVISYHIGTFLKDVRWKLIDPLKKLLPELKNEIEIRKGRVQSNAYIHFKKGVNWPWVVLRTKPLNDKVRLIIHSEVWMSPINKSHELKECIVEANAGDEFTKFEDRFHQLSNKHQGFNFIEPYSFITKNYGSYVMHLQSTLDLKSPEAFFEPDYLEKISIVISDIYNLTLELESIGFKVRNYFDKNKVI